MEHFKNNQVGETYEEGVAVEKPQVAVGIPKKDPKLQLNREGDRG